MGVVMARWGVVGFMVLSALVLGSQQSRQNGRWNRAE